MEKGRRIKWTDENGEDHFGHFLGVHQTMMTEIPRKPRPPSDVLVFDCDFGRLDAAAYVEEKYKIKIIPATWIQFLE